MNQRVEQFYPASPWPQPLVCSWCLRRGTDLETEIDGSFVCMDEAECQPVHEARTAGKLYELTAYEQRKLAWVLTEEMLDARAGQIPVLDF